MRTAGRRAAWAEWAGWTCKEPGGSLRSVDHRRLVDRRPPSGNRRGFLFVERPYADRAGCCDERVRARSAGRQAPAATPSLATRASKEVERLPRMRHTCKRDRVVPCIPVATRRCPPPKEYSMFSSNLAVRMKHTATDLLSHPPRPLLRIVAGNERSEQKVRQSTSFKNRKFFTRDQGLRYLRIR
jgi:hypothetical protein